VSQQPLKLAAKDDPRLDAEIASALKALKIPSDFGGQIRMLATGEAPASSLRCCGSGCRPCVKDLHRCTVRVLTRLEAPPRPEPASVTGLRLRARGRGLLRRLRGED